MSLLLDQSLGEDLQSNCVSCPDCEPWQSPVPFDDRSGVRRSSISNMDGRRERRAAVNLKGTSVGDDDQVPPRKERLQEGSHVRKLAAVTSIQAPALHDMAQLPWRWDVAKCERACTEVSSNFCAAIMVLAARSSACITSQRFSRPYLTSLALRLRLTAELYLHQLDNAARSIRARDIHAQPPR